MSNEHENEQQQMSEEEQRELRNSVLKAKQAAEGGGASAAQPASSGPEVSKEEYARQELGFDIPLDAVPLPTAGKIYPPDHPLHGKADVQYRAMTAREEDILMSQAYIKKGTVISELIKSCLMDRNIDVGSLVSGDRSALMVAIRISGYGSRYNPTYQCPSCDTQNELDIDLASLPIKNLQIEPAEAYTNLFHYKLPVTGKTVGFKFLTGSEEEEIVKMQDAKKKKGIYNSNMVTTRLQYSIVEVDGERDKNRISKFVQYMPARDSLSLREHIDNNEPGIDMNVEFTCDYCEHVGDISLPFGPTFFWPNART